MNKALSSQQQRSAFQRHHHLQVILAHCGVICLDVKLPQDTSIHELASRLEKKTKISNANQIILAQDGTKLSLLHALKDYPTLWKKKTQVCCIAKQPLSFFFLCFVCSLSHTHTYTHSLTPVLYINNRYDVVNVLVKIQSSAGSSKGVSQPSNPTISPITTTTATSSSSIHSTNTTAPDSSSSSSSSARDSLQASSEVLTCSLDSKSSPSSTLLPQANIVELFLFDKQHLYQSPSISSLLLNIPLPAKSTSGFLLEPTPEQNLPHALPSRPIIYTTPLLVDFPTFYQKFRAQLSEAQKLFQEYDEDVQFCEASLSSQSAQIRAINSAKFNLKYHVTILSKEYQMFENSYESQRKDLAKLKKEYDIKQVITGLKEILVDPQLQKRGKKTLLDFTIKSGKSGHGKYKKQNQKNVSSNVENENPENPDDPEYTLHEDYKDLLNQFQNFTIKVERLKEKILNVVQPPRSSDPAAAGPCPQRSEICSLSIYIIYIYNIVRPLSLCTYTYILVCLYIYIYMLIL